MVKEARTRLWEPQLGIQRLPYAATKPEQGSFTLMVKPKLLSLARNPLSTLLHDEIVTHTAVSLTAIQSGSPPTWDVSEWALASRHLSADAALRSGCFHSRHIGRLLRFEQSNGRDQPKGDQRDQRDKAIEGVRETLSVYMQAVCPNVEDT